MSSIPYFHDDPDYLHALVNDYLELMGGEPTSTDNNNLLTEYDHSHPHATVLTEDSIAE